MDDIITNFIARSIICGTSVFSQLIVKIFISYVVFFLKNRLTKLFVSLFFVFIQVDNFKNADAASGLKHQLKK